ncbi:MAG: FAD:protein FMN transferase [Acutalibacter sp.]|nr:FAD:protein FMN transferase [Acutalibacter sp.]
MKEKFTARRILAGLLFFLLVGGAAALYWHKEPEPKRLETFAMGSYMQQSLWGGEETAAQEASEAVAALENEISWRRQGSIAQLNQAAGGSGGVMLSPQAAAVLGQALLISEKSGGALDPTLGPLTRLWDFDGSPRLPGEKELAEALALVDYRALDLAEEGRASLQQAGMQADLGAVGKGAACDAAVACYQEKGVQAAVVAVGGSVGLWGQKPGGSPWQVSVRDPEGVGSLGVLRLEGGFVSTSGSYEKFFEQEGKTYCHLLDPATGYPAQSGLVSVTVWHMESGALSDGLATACFVLGQEKGIQLLEAFGAGGVFVTEKGVITATGPLKEKFTLTNPL